MIPEEFDKFRHDAIHDLMRLNDACERGFQISSWPRWDYDLDCGTLTFSQDGAPRVVASIEAVGTTSIRDGTWMWSWANESIPNRVTRLIASVKAFGEKESLLELTTPELNDDDHLGWAMTSIAAKILGAKGGYRCPSEKGFLYVVYTDLSFAVADNNPSHRNRIQCGTHGFGYQSFICEHLLSEPVQFWFSNPPMDEDQWPDAWCAGCEALFQELGEWNDKNEKKANIKVVCHYCYESLRSKGQKNKQ